jgi:hypothetical protein
MSRKHQKTDPQRRATRLDFCQIYILVGPGMGDLITFGTDHLGGVRAGHRETLLPFPPRAIGAKGRSTAHLVPWPAP